MCLPGYLRVSVPEGCKICDVQDHKHRPLPANTSDTGEDKRYP